MFQMMGYCKEPNPTKVAAYEDGKQLAKGRDNTILHLVFMFSIYVGQQNGVTVISPEYAHGQ